MRNPTGAAAMLQHHLYESGITFCTACHTERSSSLSASVSSLSTLWGLCFIGGEGLKYAPFSRKVLEQTAEMPQRCVSGGLAAYSWVRRDASGIEDHRQRVLHPRGQIHPETGFSPTVRSWGMVQIQRKPALSCRSPWYDHHHCVRICQCLGGGVNTTN